MTKSRCAVVFDWNGTVLADTTLCVAANNETFKMVGGTPVSVARFRELYEIPLVHMYKAVGCNEREVIERRAELGDAFTAYYDKHASRVRARRGAKTALAALKQDGYKLAVLSNYTVDRISFMANRLGLTGYFDAILANENASAIYAKGKSKGERLKDFAEQNETRNAIVIGDSPEEIHIAHSYGFLGVAITDGFCSTARLRAAKPDFIVSSLAAIPAIAEKVFSGGGK